MEKGCILIPDPGIVATRVGGGSLDGKISDEQIFTLPCRHLCWELRHPLHASVAK